MSITSTMYIQYKRACQLIYNIFKSLSHNIHIHTRTLKIKKRFDQEKSQKLWKPLKRQISNRLGAQAHAAHGADAEPRVAGRADNVAACTLVHVVGPLVADRTLQAFRQGSEVKQAWKATTSKTSKIVMAEAAITVWGVVLLALEINDIPFAIE